MSTLVFFRAPECLGRKKKDQKRGAKIQDDPEAFRQQRLEHQNMLRRKKRDQILEERRHVMESLEWMSVVGNEELEKWNESYDAPPERLLQALTMSRTDSGSRHLLTSTSSDVIPLIFHLMERNQHLEVVLDIIANLIQQDASFAQHVVTPEFMTRMEIMFRDATAATQFLLCRIVAFIAGMHPSLITHLQTCRILPHMHEALYFGTGETKHEVLRFLFIVANTGTDEQMGAVFDNELVDALEGVLTGDGQADSAFRAMQVLQTVFSKRQQVPAVQQIIERVGDKLHEAIDRLFESENMDVSALAAILLDHLP